MYYHIQRRLFIQTIYIPADIFEVVGRPQYLTAFSLILLQHISLYELQANFPYLFKLNLRIFLRQPVDLFPSEVYRVCILQKSAPGHIGEGLAELTETVNKEL